MADGGLPLEAVPPDIYYKCHPNKVNSTVFCVLCENVWHKSDFNRKKGVKYVSNVLVICDEHPEVKLTSKSDLNDDARIALYALKSKLGKKEQEYENSIKCFSQLKKNYDSLLQKYNEQIEKSQNETDGMDITMNENDNSPLKTEVLLLRELNSELKSKNSLLEELLEKEKQIPKLNKKSYADITADKQVLSERPKNIPKIIVKRKDSKDKSNMKEKVLYYLTKDRSIQTKKIEVRDKNEIKISCVSQESAKTAKNYLEVKLNHMYKVDKEELKNPIIKIVGVENMFNLELKSLESDINTRNFTDLKEKGKILNVSNNNKYGKCNIVMEVTSSIHKYIKEKKDRLFVGYQNCKVYDVINIKPCFKCARFGHSPFKCKNTPTCLKCAGTHLTSKCNNNNKCCANCQFNNISYGTKYNTTHTAIDRENCEILQKKINKIENTTDYLIKPFIPRFLGKTDNFKTSNYQTTQENARLSKKWKSNESLLSNTSCASGARVLNED